MRRMYSQNQIANMATVDNKDINPSSVETDEVYANYVSTDSFGCHGMIIEESGGETVIDGQGESNITGMTEVNCNSLITGGIQCDGANDCFIEGYMEIETLDASNVSLGSPSNDGYVFLRLPTSDPHEQNALWNDNGTLKISQG